MLAHPKSCHEAHLPPSRLFDVNVGGILAAEVQIAVKFAAAKTDDRGMHSATGPQRTEDYCAS
jgi:hypothetical protein